MEIERIKKAIEDIHDGLMKYNEIMNLINKTDVSINKNFQRLYNGFYKMRQREPEFYEEYFKYLEEHKNKDVEFYEVLNHFYMRFNRIEASFSSKLIATINPNQPIIDQYVLKNLNLKKPTYSDRNRLIKTVQVYADVCKGLNEIRESEEGKEIIRQFDEKYPNFSITDIKKIDLVFWQIR
jgi:hypothetical protein